MSKRYGDFRNTPNSHVWENAESRQCKAEGWITNTPGELKGYWPRRAGVVYRQGKPCPSKSCTSSDLKASGYCGIYIVGDIPGDFWSREKLGPDKYWNTVDIDRDEDGTTTGSSDDKKK